jgi:hypothetical protein
VTAKARKELSTPKTPAAGYRFAVTSAKLESDELAALRKVPTKSSAQRKAVDSIAVDIAEVETAVKDWESGKRQAFIGQFTLWANDHRPARAFKKAGAKACT